MSCFCLGVLHSLSETAHPFLCHYWTIPNVPHLWPIVLTSSCRPFSLMCLLDCRVECRTTPSSCEHWLRTAVKDQLISLEIPDSLDAVISLTNKLDNCLKDRARERVSSVSSVRSWTYEQQPQCLPAPEPSVSTLESPKGEPMQLGWARLSPEEWQGRLREGLYIYCGQYGHFLATCPVRTPDSPANVKVVVSQTLFDHGISHPKITGSFASSDITVTQAVLIDSSRC